jgi:hypothetical protein
VEATLLVHAGQRLAYSSFLCSRGGATGHGSLSPLYNVSGYIRHRYTNREQRNCQGEFFH